MGFLTLCLRQWPKDHRWLRDVFISDGWTQQFSFKGLESSTTDSFEAKEGDFSYSFNVLFFSLACHFVLSVQLFGLLCVAAFWPGPPF